MTKLDITSTTVEKSIDLVKGFLEKISGAAIEETGLMFADNIKLRRFKNQLKIFAKAQKIAEESGINIKTLSLKSLVPLVEFSSLEDEETLQDKWSNLIVNFIDSNSIYESSIYPFILNQITREELLELEKVSKVNFISLRNFDISNASISNLVRLGLLQLRPSTGNYIYNEGEKPPIKYIATDLGKDFIKCCSVPLIEAT